MTRRARFSDRFTFGGRIPGIIGLLLVVTVGLSLVTAFGSRHGPALFDLAALAPQRVWRGEVWRLLTWAFIEPSPLWLLFACLLLYWFGRDLIEAWGSARFLSTYLGITLVAGAGTCLLGLLDGDVQRASYIGGWPTAAAITVAWGLCYPDRLIRIWFVLPIRGDVLAWLTVGLTVVSAVYFGWERFVPSLLAQGVMLAWLFRGWLRARRRSWHRSIRELRERAGRRRAEEKKRATVEAVAETLRSLEAVDQEAPPMPPEVERVLDRILDEVSREERAKRHHRGIR